MVSTFSDSKIFLKKFQTYNFFRGTDKVFHTEKYFILFIYEKNPKIVQIRRLIRTICLLLKFLRFFMQKKNQHKSISKNRELRNAPIFALFAKKIAPILRFSSLFALKILCTLTLFLLCLALYTDSKRKIKQGMLMYEKIRSIIKGFYKYRQPSVHHFLQTKILSFAYQNFAFYILEFCLLHTRILPFAD